MSKLLTYGSVGRAPGNRCLYPDRAEINPGRWNSRAGGMKFGNVTQWVRGSVLQVPPD
jgi:hypothetical protein